MGSGGGTAITREEHVHRGERKISVLIADDDHDLVNTVATLLEEKGMIVIGKAYDGEEAAQKYFQHKPDVVLLDMSMPNYDDNYAIEKIKLKDPNAKIIVVSAYLDKFFPADKVSAVFSKPADINAVVDRIKKITS